MIQDDRRSGIDTRSDEDKRHIGERRSGIDRRANCDVATPSNEQFAQFARRMKRIMRDPGARAFLGNAIGEGNFAFYPDVIRVMQWMERPGGDESTDKTDNSAKPTLRKPMSVAFDRS